MEKIEDLGIKGYRVIQTKDSFCFGSDAVLLARFAELKKGWRVLDMCTGTGIVALLSWALHDLESVDAMEIVPFVADMARRTMSLNGLSDNIKVITADIKDAASIYGKRVFDAVTVNPPYMNSGGGLVNPNDVIAAARHELLCTLDDVVKSAAEVLKPQGKLFMVHRADRLCDVITVFRKYRLEPKRLSMVQATSRSAPNLILIEGSLYGKAQLKITPPVTMYDDDGNYIQSIKGSDS